MIIMTKKSISVAEARLRFSELVVRAAFGGEQFVITRRGRPAAVLAPARRLETPPDLADVRGWLPNDDPLFRALAEARRASQRRGPRAWRQPQ